MRLSGWKQLFRGAAWLDRRGRYSIPAYSEFMPPPRLGLKPYRRDEPEAVDRRIFDPDDPWGWRISEYEQAFELDPGLERLAREIIGVLHHLGRCEPAHGISKTKLKDNPYWPAELAEHGAGAQERYVIFMPLALSQTQDDKGRVRWTLFGGSEQGPAKAFWRSFWKAPHEPAPAAEAKEFFERLLVGAYGESPDRAADLRAAGFRIYHEEASAAQTGWDSGPLPDWTDELRWQRGRSLHAVKYLLTFEPFARLPAPVRRAYLAGDLHLLPFPGSLVFWGVQAYRRLAEKLPWAAQIPLLHSFERREAPGGIRIPQSGWMHEPVAGAPAEIGSHGPLRNHFQRTHRWARIHRHEDELAVTAGEDKVAHVLFSTAADDLGLYGKPMARNAQIWTHEFELLLDGPRADRRQLAHAAERLAAGGVYGYRFFYPAMQAGGYHAFWHRPLVAWLSSQTGEAELCPRAPLGYLTAYRADRPPREADVELWPRLLDRADHQAAARIFDYEHDHGYHRTTVNVRKIIETWDLLGREPLSRTFGRQLLTLSKHESLDAWLASLPQRTENVAAGRLLAEMLEDRVQAPAESSAARTARPPASLTFQRTARRSFETAYWNAIAELATGRYVNKDNADCVRDSVTQQRLQHPERDLEALGDHLVSYYQRVIAEQNMTGKSLVGELPFLWQTDFEFPWSGGWSANQDATAEERDIVCVIPGRDRRRAVIMADHYDTAYMEDVYGYGHGGGGPRLSAAGADDNHSATAALMLGAPIFMELSRAGKLACDVWLVHLTGEEFPSDCLGARRLCQELVERRLKLRLPGGKRHDLSHAQVQGAYVLDMVAHNNDRDRDVFQICPGSSRESMWLAWQAHEANRTWNESIPVWNNRSARRNLVRGRRSADGAAIPGIALHPELSGEVRPSYDPRSTLYNTDGQIFSDAGVPVVLFMENYDINRQGYHDTHDTLANIDLDYGAAVAAIAIEAVARAAALVPGRAGSRPSRASRRP